MDRKEHNTTIRNLLSDLEQESLTNTLLKVNCELKFYETEDNIPKKNINTVDQLLHNQSCSSFICKTQTYTYSVVYGLSSIKNNDYSLVSLLILNLKKISDNNAKSLKFANYACLLALSSGIKNSIKYGKLKHAPQDHPSRLYLHNVLEMKRRRYYDSFPNGN